MPASKENKPLNIYQKIVEIRKSVTSLPKNAKGYNYEYADGSIVLASVRKKMDELQVLLNVEVVEQGKSQVLVKVWSEKAKALIERLEWVIDLKINYTWINAENPEDKLSIPFPAFGQQSDPAHAMGSALTYSERYFLLKQLQIPTDSADSDNGDGHQTEKQEMQKCPLCSEKKVMISKFKGKGKYYCNGCKESFESLTGNGKHTEPQKPKGQSEQPKEESESFMATLSALKNDENNLFSQIEEKHRKSIEKCLKGKNLNDPRIQPWIGFLKREYEKLAMAGNKISQDQIGHLMSIADRSGYSEDYIKQIIKAFPYEYDSRKDILQKDYDAIIKALEVPISAE